MRSPVVLVTALAHVIIGVGCSGSHAPAPTRSGPPAPMIATPANDDVQVATVNGRPVFGSCVTAQAARGATRDEALQQCIDFELMAQAAEARGLAVDHEVVLETRTAIVSQLVAHEYEDKFTRPEDFGSFWTRSIERNRGRFDHPEARGSVYARIDVAKKPAPGEDERAKQLSEELYAALANERGLMKPHLEEIAKRVVGTRGPLKIAAVPPDLRHGRLDDTYAAAMFAIPELGRVSAPVRTPWGWDVILWDSVVPEVHATPDELVKSALPDVKRGYFPYWVNKLAASLGLHVQVEDKNLPLLENL
ncbi:MAG TPA: peptidylprolyl isomerase [Kofleriaceae bacterium]